MENNLVKSNKSGSRALVGLLLTSFFVAGLLWGEIVFSFLKERAEKEDPGELVLKDDLPVENQFGPIEKDLPPPEEDEDLNFFLEIAEFVLEKLEKKEKVRENWPPAPPSMEKIKTKGCVTDGLLSGYGKEEKNLKMINRSECEYLHRAIETWLDAPDFDEIEDNMEELEKKDLIIGMFIAEAIDTKEDLYYPNEDRDFDFSKMCREKTKNYWGEHTCIPDLKKKEYQRYVLYITKRAMEMGVQSFTFGQIDHQDDLDDPQIQKIINTMKINASLLGIEIVVGAQTNSITDEKYLKFFDYIEGGTGLRPNGNIEDGACFSRWWKKPGDWCWALLWHETYAAKANNVLIHLDWSGKPGDDMSTFARMSQEKRAQTLEKLYNYFTGQGHGFLLPFMTALPLNNGGCYGEKERYYSANKKYSCDDEGAINEILGKEEE
ncbi:MAG: hypothetical protein GF347_05035 [Candidatus Moranbacteria bacterium]|nr:hypothetical protein [Candidatus Moranbacteria bacterium]